MEIYEITDNKKQYLTLLLLADEQEDMIDRYLERGTMYVLEDGGVKAECVVTDEGEGILEIKNLATEPDYQGKGYGRALIEFLAEKYTGKYSPSNLNRYYSIFLPIVFAYQQYVHFLQE
jgi:GNAT superfamily N-acetyltransferase